MSTNAEQFETPRPGTVGADSGRSEPEGRGKLRTLRDSVSAVFGAVLGLLPHVMHHIGFIAGAALVTGVFGNALLFAVGLLFSIPLLRRLYRRFRTWWAPVIAVVVFAILFSLSAFVIGPAISGGATADGNGPPAPTAPSQTPSDDHAAHHAGE